MIKELSLFIGNNSNFAKLLLYNTQFQPRNSWKSPNFLIFSPKDTEKEPLTVRSAKLKLPEKAWKKKLREIPLQV